MEKCPERGKSRPTCNRQAGGSGLAAGRPRVSRNRRRTGSRTACLPAGSSFDKPRSTAGAERIMRRGQRCLRKSFAQPFGRAPTHWHACRFDFPHFPQGARLSRSAGAVASRRGRRSRRSLCHVGASFRQPSEGRLHGPLDTVVGATFRIFWPCRHCLQRQESGLSFNGLRFFGFFAFSARGLVAPLAHGILRNRPAGRKSLAGLPNRVPAICATGAEESISAVSHSTRSPGISAIPATRIFSASLALPATLVVAAGVAPIHSAIAHSILKPLLLLPNLFPPFPVRQGSWRDPAGGRPAQVRKQRSAW